MSAIIKAVGVKFNDDSLPILSPMITNGLVGAFRPTNKSMGLIDLSGNGHILTTVGNPTLTENSAIVNNSNGFLTDIKETLDLTFFIVHRVIKNTNSQSNDNGISGLTVNSYADNRGVSIWHELLNGEINTSAQSYLKRLSDNSMQNLSWAISKQPSTNDAGIIEVTAFSLKASNNAWQLYSPAKQSTPVNSYDASIDNSRFDLRYLSDPATGIPNYYKIGVIDMPFPSGKNEIFELLIYNRALTQDEIMRQYQYSKDFMQKHRGVTI